MGLKTDFQNLFGSTGARTPKDAFVVSAHSYCVCVLGRGEQRVLKVLTTMCGY